MLKRRVTKQFKNKVYYIPCYAFSTYWNNVTTIDGKTILNGYEVLSCDITDNMQFKIVTNEVVECGFKCDYVATNYEPTIYNSVDDIGTYIFDIAKPMSISIIFSMYKGMYKVVDKELSINDKIVYKYIPSVNYESAKKIVESGYTDTIFNDLVSTVMLYLVENKKHIEIVNNNHGVIFNAWVMYLDIYKEVRKYLYANKQVEYKYHSADIYINTGIEKDKEELINCIGGAIRNACKCDNYNVRDLDTNCYHKKTVSIKSKDYFKYQYETLCNSVDVDTIKSNIIVWLSNYSNEYKAFMCKGVENVVDGLIKGYSLKDIAKIYHISINTVTKYKRLLNNAFNEYKLMCIDNHLMVFDLLGDNDNVLHNRMYAVKGAAYTPTELHNDRYFLYNELFKQDNNTMVIDYNNKGVVAYNPTELDNTCIIGSKYQYKKGLQDRLAIKTRQNNAICNNSNEHIYKALANIATVRINNGDGNDLEMEQLHNDLLSQYN